MYLLDPVLKIIYKCMYYMCNLKELYFKWHQFFLVHQLQEEYSKTKFLLVSGYKLYVSFIVFIYLMSLLCVLNVCTLYGYAYSIHESI